MTNLDPSFDTTVDLIDMLLLMLRLNYAIKKKKDLTMLKIMNLNFDQSSFLDLLFFMSKTL